jgi:asparagine synthase (glutamine-hydrolysing)
MCGITGFVTRGAARCWSDDLPNAIAAVDHRGPDDSGQWSDRGVGLGHRRLSILDLTEHGHQPMVSRDGRFVMVFNGEVYNFAEIRRRLESLGHRFEGTGDSEVILAAFQEWGKEAVRRFIGMFAIAFWDKQEERLTLLRDRLGVKPLYYGWDGTTLFFGSELKSLRAFKAWQPEVDRDGLSDYFRFGYISGPRTIYKRVSRLLPGHSLELADRGEPLIQPYWSILDVVDAPLTGSDEDLAEQLEELMIDAFKLRMISDVPVGMFLSGGIDSSLVTAILQKHFGTQVHTFTIGFNEKKHNEAPHARLVAEHLGTNHTERVLETLEAKAILPKWGAIYDEPFADSSGIPTYLVSRVASEQVKVVLSADGGDELFSGYTVYSDALTRVARRARIPRPLRSAIVTGGNLVHPDKLDEWVSLSPLSMRLRRAVSARLTRPASRIHAYLSAATSGEMYAEAMSFWRGSDLAHLTCGQASLRETADAYPGSFAEQMCLWDLHNYLPDDILVKVDRATMAVSIEGREPLLDHRIAEFAFRLPLHLRRGSLGPKHILRKILYKYVPREIVDRPKMGFGIPLLGWLRGDMNYLIGDYLDPASIKSQGLLDPELVARTVETFQRGDDHAVGRVWTLLAFQMWRETCA